MKKLVLVGFFSLSLFVQARDAHVIEGEVLATYINHGSTDPSGAFFVIKEPYARRLTVVYGFYRRPVNPWGPTVSKIWKTRDAGAPILRMPREDEDETPELKSRLIQLTRDLSSDGEIHQRHLEEMADNPPPEVSFPSPVNILNSAKFPAARRAELLERARYYFLPSESAVAIAAGPLKCKGRLETSAAQASR